VPQKKKKKKKKKQLKFQWENRQLLVGQCLIREAQVEETKKPLTPWRVVKVGGGSREGF
jgi:hypothetical protein